MIKKLLLVLAALMPMCMTAQIVKIAVVNIQDVYDACPEKAAAQAALSELSQQYKQEYKLMQDDFGKNTPTISVLPTTQKCRLLSKNAA